MRAGTFRETWDYCAAELGYWGLWDLMLGYLLSILRVYSTMQYTKLLYTVYYILLWRIGMEELIRWDMEGGSPAMSLVLFLLLV